MRKPGTFKRVIYMSYTTIMTPERKAERRELDKQLNMIWRYLRYKRVNPTMEQYDNLMLYRAVLLNKYKEAGFVYQGKL